MRVRPVPVRVLIYFFLCAITAAVVMNMIESGNIKRTGKTTEVAASTLYLGRDGEWWDAIMIWSLGAVALAGVFVLITTTGSINAHKREAAAAKADLDQYKSEVSGKVAEAKDEGIKAGEAAGNALVRAAQLEKEAEYARLETQRLKQVVSWRELSHDTSESLLASLKTSPGSVNVRYTDGDPEALYLTIQIANILGKAGRSVAPGASKMNSIIFGIVIADGDNDTGTKLESALTSVGIPFRAGPLPQTGMGIELLVSSIPGAPTLFVGSKPPPALQ